MNNYTKNSFANLNLISEKALQKKLKNPPISLAKVVNLTGRDLTIFTGTPPRPLHVFKRAETTLTFEERPNRRRVEILSIDDKFIDVWSPYNLKVSQIPEKYKGHDLLLTRVMAEILTRDVRSYQNRNRFLCADLSTGSCVFHPQTGALLGVRRLSVLNTVPLIV